MNVPVREETITSTMKKVSRKAYFSVGLTHFTRLQSAPPALTSFFFFPGRAYKPIMEESSHKVHRRRCGEYAILLHQKKRSRCRYFWYSKHRAASSRRGVKSGFKGATGKGEKKGVAVSAEEGLRNRSSQEEREKRVLLDYSCFDRSVVKSKKSSGE